METIYTLKNFTRGGLTLLFFFAFLIALPQNSMAQTSTYEFEYEIRPPLCQDQAVEVDVTFKTVDPPGTEGYNGVRYAIKSAGPGDITFEAEDHANNLHTFTNNFYWGPVFGLDIPADYYDTTEWTLYFSDVGDYTITYSLIYAPDGDVVENYEIEIPISIIPTPAIGFSFDGDLADTGDIFHYCLNQPISVTLSHVWAGAEPFDIEWTVDGNPHSITGVNLGDGIGVDIFHPGEYDIEITSIIDANGCSPADYSPYQAQVIIYDEPAIGFSFNGDLAGTGDVFEYCYNEIVTVTLSHIWAGLAPFTIEYKVGDDTYTDSFDLDDILFEGYLPADTYSIEIISISDANDCIVSDVSPYEATVIVNPEPIVGFSFNGELADTGEVFEYCYNEPVSVTLSHIWSGTPPFTVSWEVLVDGVVDAGLSGTETGIDTEGHVLLPYTLLNPGTYVVNITEILDAGNCEPVDIDDYTATVIVHGEPIIGFSFNEVLVDTDDIFSYCYNEMVTVTLSHVWSGTEPFNIQWKVGDVTYEDTFYLGDIMFEGYLDPDTYEIEIISIEDVNGCVAGDVDPYKATVIINAEPAIGLSFNGELADTGDVFEYCYNETVSVTLSHVWSGTAPFYIEWEVNGVQYDGSFEIDDNLFGPDLLISGTHDIVITSIEDANGCKPADLAPYYATVIVHPEPAIGFSFNGELAGTGDVFEYCYNETVSVTLSHVWSGTAPFYIEWEVNGDQYDGYFEIDDNLFEPDLLISGTYDIVITSIIDANGCEPSDLTPYEATVIVHPETIADITGIVDGLCYTGMVVLELDLTSPIGADFVVTWTINDIHTVVVTNTLTFDFDAADYVDDGIEGSEIFTVYAHIINQWGCESTTDEEQFAVVGPPTITRNLILAPPHTVYCTSIPGGVIIYGDGEVEWDDLEFHAECDLQFQWYRSLNFGVSWSRVGGEGQYAYYQLPSVPVTTFYKRGVKIGGDDCPCEDDDMDWHFSNIIEMYVLDEPIGIAEIIDIPVSPVCIDDVNEITLNAEPAPDHVTGIWTAIPDTGVTFSDVNDPTATLTATEPGVYELTWSFILDDNVHPNCGEDSHDSITISFEEIISIDPIDVVADACYNDAPILLEAPDFIVVGELAGWEFTGTGVELVGDDYYFNPILAGVGSHDIIFTLTTSGGCIDSEDTTIIVNEEPVLAFEFNGELAGTGSVFEYCYNEMVTVTLATVHAGTGPFDITLEVNGVEEVHTGIGEGDDLISELLAAGVYNIVVTDITDANGCSVTTPELFYNATVEVFEQPVLAFTFNGELAVTDSEFEYCYDETVTIALATVHAGTGPFDITIEVNGVEEVHTGIAEGEELISKVLAVGVYNIVVTDITDANGCSVTTPELFYTATVEIFEEPVLAFEFNGELAQTGSVFEYCFNEPVSVVLAAVHAGKGPFAITIEVNGEEEVYEDIAEGDVLFSEPLDAGVYNIVVTDITDANGCSVTTPELVYTATVEIFEEPVLAFEFNGELAETGSVFQYCFTEPVSVTLATVHAGTGPFDITIEVNGVPEVHTNVVEGDELFGALLTPGTYDVVVTDITDANGCSVITPGLFYNATVEIYEEPVLAFEFNGELAATGSVFEYCYNEEVTVTLVTVHSGVGPFDITLEVNGVAEVHENIVEGDVLFDEILPVGTYDIVITDITDTNGCSVISPELFYNATVVVNEEPVIAFEFNGELAGTGSVFEYCYDELVTVTLATVHAGTGPFDITLEVNGVEEVHTGIGEGDDLISEVLAAGVYNIVVTDITDANGCSVTTPELFYNATVEVFEQPVLAFEFNGELAVTDSEFEYCYNEIVTVTLATVHAGTGPFDITIEVNGVAEVYTDVAEGDDLISEVLAAGVYNIVVTDITDANGCSVTTPELFYTATVEIFEEPVLAFEFNGELAQTGSVFEYCFNEPVTVTLAAVHGGLAPFNITVEVNGNQHVFDNVDVGDVLFGELLDIGLYDIIVTEIVDANGCSVTTPELFYNASVEVFEEPVLAFTFNNELAETGSEFTYCYNTPVSVTLATVHAGTGPFDITIEVNGVPEVYTDVAEGDVIFDGPLGAGTYDIVVTDITDAKGCSVIMPELFYNATVEILEEPILAFAFNDVIADTDDVFEYCYNSPVTVTLADAPAGLAPFDITVEINGEEHVFNGVNVGDDLITEMPEAGTYSITVTGITDANGCSVTTPEMFYRAVVVIVNCVIAEVAETYVTAETAYVTWDDEANHTYSISIPGIVDEFVAVNDASFDGLDPDTTYDIILKTSVVGKEFITTSTFTTLKKGDVNADLVINILDIELLVAKITNNLGDRVIIEHANELAQVNGDVFILDAADMNDDDVIDIFDIVRLVNVVFPPIDDKMNSEAASIYLSPDMISLESDGSLVALQFELTGNNLEEVVMSMNVPGIYVAWKVEGDVLTAIVFSPDNKLIDAGKTLLIDITGGVDLKWGNAYASNLLAERVELYTHYDMPTGIVDFDSELTMEVFPNPSKGQFTSRVNLPANANVNFRLYDMSGRQVAYKQLETVTGIEDVSWNLDLLPGLYVLRMMATPTGLTGDIVTREVRIIIN